MPCRNPLDHAPHDYLADSDAITLSPCPGKATMSYEMPDCESLDEAMVAANEVYHAARRGGFTRHQALHVAMGQACCDKEPDDE